MRGKRLEDRRRLGRALDNAAGAHRDQQVELATAFQEIAGSDIVQPDLAGRAPAREPLGGDRRHRRRAFDRLDPAAMGLGQVDGHGGVAAAEIQRLQARFQRRDGEHAVQQARRQRIAEIHLAIGDQHRLVGIEAHGECPIRSPGFRRCLSGARRADRSCRGKFTSRDARALSSLAGAEGNRMA